jgi:DNA-binding transcriptional LysR family regulator
MDRITALRVFVEVADCGSLTQTAQRLDMSAAMVSRYLAAAEDWLGARLLHRTTRRVSLTDAGEAALATSRQMLGMAEDVAALAGARTREPTGALRITASPSFADAQLATAMAEFQRLHPRVELTLLVGDRALDLVEDRIDLAVRISNTLDPTVIARPLALCRSVLCASPQYLAQHGQPATLADLPAHRFATRTVGDGDVLRFDQAGAEVEVAVHGVLRTDDTITLRRAVLAGAGIGMLPTYYVGEDLRRGALVRLLPALEPATLGIHAVYLSRRHQPLAQRVLVDYLAERFGGEPAPWDRDLPPGGG